MRPFVLLSAMLALLALGFYITSMSTSSWLVQQSPGEIQNMGIFRSCLRRTDGNINECRRADDDCVSTFSGGYVLGAGNNCGATRAVRAFVIIAAVLSAFAFLFHWLGSFAESDFPVFRLSGGLFSLLAAISGIISFAVFTGMARTYDDAWEYGFSYALMTAAWCINLLAVALGLIAHPVAAMDTMISKATGDRFNAYSGTGVGARWTGGPVTVPPTATTAGNYGYGTYRHGAPAGVATEAERPPVV